MRYYQRTGPRSGISVGWLGMMFLAFGYLFWWMLIAMVIVAGIGLALLASVAFVVAAIVAASSGYVADRIEPGLSVEAPPRRFGEALVVLFRGMFDVARGLARRP